MATRSQRWLYWLLCWALVFTLLPPGEPFPARGQSDDSPDTPADQHLYLPLVQSDQGTEETAAEESFRFELDPETETLVHQSSLEDDAPSDEATSSDETLAATQPSATPRQLNPKRELAIATFRYEFQANRKTIFWVSFTNITRDALFLLPLTFQVNRLTFNVAASVEPTLSAVDLGGDGILSPGETTAEVRFDVTHRGKLFLYVVDAYAVVQPRSALPATTACDLYPIALHSDTLASVAVGDTVNNILNGAGAGNFGWLTWTGDNSATALVASLIAPGNAHTYVNPNNPADHKVSVGDWVRGRPGVANAVAVRNALNTLKTIDITVPVWGATQGNGANSQYQITNFALVRLLDYALPGQNRISVRFLGYNQHCGENQPPVGVPDTYATDEDVPLLVSAPGVLTNDVDADALTALLVRPVMSGTLALQADGALVYTPTLNFHGVDRFTYVASDGALASDAVTVTVTVRPVNDPPLAQADTATTAEDMAATLAVLTNDRDGDGESLTIMAVTTPQQGSVTQNSDGTLLYTPAANRCGADEFSYTVADPSGATATATVTITVTCLNDPPSAHDDTAATDAATPVTIAVLANDLDVDGDTLALAQVGAPGHGSASANADQRVTYTPAPGFSSSDHFTYTVCDAGPLCATAVVTVAVNQTNQPPVAVDDAVTTPEETPLTIDVAANDSDPDGNLAPATATALAPPLHGALTPLGNGRFSYTPTLDYHGVDHFPYQICDSAGLCALATVTLTITPVNDAPVAVDDRYDAVEDTPLTIGAPGLLGNDRDGDGDALTLVGASQPGNGAVNVNLDSSFTYTPNPDFCGDDSFSYTISDGQAEATATVTLAVACVEDIPVTTLLESAPANGEGAVSLTRETVLIFSAPLAAASVSAATIGAYRDDQPLATQVRLSPDRQRVILFYAQPLPAAAHIEVRLAGDDLRDDLGNAVDGDNDGQPGGAGVVAFDTLNLTRIPGTHVWGYVYDSYNKNPDGSDIPIAGATIRVDGLPEANAVTDETGYFILEDMPAPLFFVHIDGSTATSAPPGTIYATVGKAFHSVAAQSTQLVMDGATFHVYLPPMSQGDVRALSPTANTAIGFGAAGQAQLQQMFPNLDPAIWARTTVVFPPNAAIDAQGNPAVQAAIIPVPADRLPAPLPPHMNHQLDIAVMAPGATNFDTPAPACFPNLPDPQTGQPLAPGAKSALISFNHDTGQWEVVGPMTVSADGRLVCTDPGVGIRAPGWHGSQPGVPVTGGCMLSDSSNPPPSSARNVSLGMATNINAAREGNSGNTTVRVTFVEPTGNIVVQKGASVFFRAEGSPAGGTYEWSNGSQSEAEATENTYIVNFKEDLSSDTVTVRYTVKVDEFKNCQPSPVERTATAQITINFTDDGCHVDVSPPGPVTVTPNQPFSFLGLGEPTGGTYYWNGGMPVGSTNQDTYTANFAAKSTARVFYTCVNEQGTPVATVTQSVDVDIAPEGCSVEIDGANPQTASIGESKSFIAIGSGEAANNPGNYVWTGGDEPPGSITGNPYLTTFTSGPKTSLVEVDYNCGPATVTDNVLVDVDVVRKTFVGFQGDIIGVDLSTLFGADYSSFTSSSPFPIETNCGRAEDLENTFTSPVPTNPQPFYFVPEIDDGNKFQQMKQRGNGELVCSANFDFTATRNGSPQNLKLELRVVDDYSKENEPNSVRPGDLPLATYRKQQRLRYFGFPNNRGQQLEVSSELDDETKWAMGLFNKIISGNRIDIPTTQIISDNLQIPCEAVLDSNPNRFKPGFNINNFASSDLDDRGWSFINAPNAPRWVQFIVNLPLQYYRFMSGEQWGANWTGDVLSTVGHYPTLWLTDISCRQGGPNGYFYDNPKKRGHNDHQSGMDVDVDVTPSRYFFRTLENESIRAKGKNPDGEEVNENQNGILMRKGTRPNIMFAVRVSNVNSQDMQRWQASGWKDANVSDLDCRSCMVRANEFLILVESYNREILADHFRSLFNAVSSSGANVSQIYYNDPYFYAENNFGNKIQHRSGHANHYHIDIGPPTPQTSFYAPSLASSINASSSNVAPSIGLHYYIIINLEDDVVIQRGITREDGISHDPVILAPNTKYIELVLKASTLEVGLISTTTPDAGERFTLPDVYLNPIIIGGSEDEEVPSDLNIDTDADGLHDEGEFIVGTDPNNPDSDGDGILDGDEVRQGSNPLDGKHARTGVIATADTPGNAVDLCALNDLAAVADGAAGVAIFDITNADLPRLLSQVDTPGNAQRVACDGNWVAVADGEGGLAILDISDPRNATLRHQRSAGALGNSAVAVVAAGGIGYVGLSDGKLVSVDLASGTILERIALPTAIRDLAIAGDVLYALTVDKLQVLPLNQANLAVTASVDSLGGNKRLFIGGGVAYAAQSTGYNTYSLSDPTQPILIAQGQTGQSDWRQIVANGSGLGVAIVGVTSLTTPNINLYDLRDPSQTNRFLTQFPATGEPSAVSIYNGLAYVAAGSAGLHVVNYLAYDIQQTPPTITVNTNFPPGTAEEGQLVRLTATVSDDVQVRSVEFFVNGVKIATDGNFPFTHQFVAPRRSQQPTFTLRAQAWDTGGNMASTTEMVITLTIDTVAPTLVRISPRNGTVAGNVATVAAFFNEPMAPSSLTASSFTLTSAGADKTLNTADDLLITTGNLDFREDILGAFMTFAEGLPANRYRAAITGAVTDSAGNPLANPQTWTFSVEEIADDRDGDCIPDDRETQLGFDPDNPDSDGDGTNDGDEDFDNDGLTNCAEVIIGTDLNNADSDGDGLSDALEDLDADGLSNSAEVSLYSTNPLEPDTDADLYIDGLEVALGSDPTDGNSIPDLNGVLDEAYGATISVLNQASPADPNLPNEAYGTTISVLNQVSPADPNLPNEAYGTTISVENQTEP